MLAPESVVLGGVWGGVVLIVTLWENVRLREKLPICARLAGPTLDPALRNPELAIVAFAIRRQRTVAPESLQFVKPKLDSNYVEKCPVMPKTSDLNAQTGRKVSERPKYLTPAQLAELIGPSRGRPGRKRENCSERTVREWCKAGLIPEAYETRGGHWRIRMPLSGRTRAWLHRRCSDWPFEKGEGNMQAAGWTSEIAERLMIAEWYQRCLDEPGRSMPPITALEDPFCGEVFEQSMDPMVLTARAIHDQIMQRIQNQEHISDLLLRGWVCHFWREERRRPTVGEIADRMGLSKTAWYRRYKRKDLYQAWRDVESSLPDPKLLESVQRANNKAKKPGFASFNRDPYSDN
jgi:hypothetical protein